MEQVGEEFILIAETVAVPKPQHVEQQRRQQHEQQGDDFRFWILDFGLHVLKSDLVDEKASEVGVSTVVLPAENDTAIYQSKIQNLKSKIHLLSLIPYNLRKR